MSFRKIRPPFYTPRGHASDPVKSRTLVRGADISVISDTYKTNAEIQESMLLPEDCRLAEQLEAGIMPEQVNCASILNARDVLNITTKSNDAVLYAANKLQDLQTLNNSHNNEKPEN